MTARWGKGLFLKYYCHEKTRFPDFPAYGYSPSAILQKRCAEEEIVRYHLNTDEPGYAYFNDGDTKFAQGSAEIPESFKNDLRIRRIGRT